MTESVETVDDIDSHLFTPNPSMMIARPRLSSPIDLTTMNDTKSALPGFSPDELLALSKVTTARPTIVIYPTIPPETVIIPIVCSIIIFPILVAAIICFLRHYNRRARAKDKFRSAYQQGAAGLFSLANKIGTSKTVGRSKDSDSDRLKAPTNRFGCMPELGLDTVVEREEDDDDDDEDQSSSLANAIELLDQENRKKSVSNELPVTASVAIKHRNGHDVPQVILETSSSVRQPEVKISVPSPPGRTVVLTTMTDANGSASVVTGIRPSGDSTGLNGSPEGNIGHS